MIPAAPAALGRCQQGVGTQSHPAEEQVQQAGHLGPSRVISGGQQVQWAPASQETL